MIRSMLVCVLLLIGCGIAAGQTPANAEESNAPTTIEGPRAAVHGDFSSIASQRLIRRAPLVLSASLTPVRSQDVAPMPRDLAPAVFVVRDAMVFVRLPGLNYDLPMPGGGASGCFDRDGVQRGYAPGELTQLIVSGSPIPNPGWVDEAAPN